LREYQEAGSAVDSKNAAFKAASWEFLGRPKHYISSGKINIAENDPLKAAIFVPNDRLEAYESLQNVHLKAYKKVKKCA
jgi:hypothetical protein